MIKKTCISASEQVQVPIVTEEEASLLPDNSYVILTNRGCQSICEDFQTILLTINEAGLITDEALVDITSGAILLFEDTFTEISLLDLESHLCDLPANTSWNNLDDSPRRVVADGSGGADHETNAFDDGSAAATIIIAGTGTTPRTISHNGSTEFTCDVTFPTGNVNARLSHHFLWLKWHSDGFNDDLIAVSRFVINGTPGAGTCRIIMSFERFDEATGLNQDNIISISNILVPDSVPIRLGWRLSVDMEDIELWWALVSDLNNKTVVGTNSGTQGPYTALDGTFAFSINAAVGDGSGTNLFNLPISRVALEQL